MKIISMMLPPLAVGMMLGTQCWAQDKPGDWPAYNRTLLADRYAPQTAVTAATASRLRKICTYNVGRQTSFQTGPVVIDGTVFITTDIDTIAIDGATCAQRWRSTETYAPAAPPLHVNRGVAFVGDRVIRGTQDGRVLAYNASTGQRIWARTIADVASGESVPAAPIAWKGLVFVGNAGGDTKGVKGRMYALNALTGKVVWEQYLVPRESADKSFGPHAPAPKMPVDGWGNSPNVPITGGATWSSYSVDSVTGVLYVPGGNPAPGFMRELRPGLNPYAGALIALDAMTGTVKSAYPLVEPDFHDWDVAAAPAVFTTRGGVKLLAEAVKDGYVYGINVTSGKRVWRVATTTFDNATAPLTASGTHFCPGPRGGTGWNGASYSPRTNLVYVGAIDWCATVKLAPTETVKSGKRGLIWTGASGSPFGSYDPVEQATGWITAINADTGKVVWKRHLPAPVISAVTPTAGGVVFVADIAGNLYALNDSSGNTEWQTRTTGAAGGGIVSYETPSGEQRIAVAEGMSSPIWPTPKVDAELVIYGI